MIVTASFTGLFKTILMVLGALVLLRFLGKLNIARQNMEEERNMLARQRKFEQEKSEKIKDFGKVKIEKEAPRGNTQDVDFEEIKE